MVGVAGIDVVMPLLTRYAIDNFIMKKTTEGLTTFAVALLLHNCFSSIKCKTIYNKCR